MPLGCSTYDVWVTERGGGRGLWQLPFTSVGWDRALNDRGTATVDFDGLTGKASSKCCGEFEAVKPWKHELAIFRNTEMIWCGPVTGKTADDKGGHINASDLSVWWKRRRIHQDHIDVQRDLGVLFYEYVRDAMSTDTSPRLDLQFAGGECGVLGDRRVLASEYAIAWPKLQELAESGCDWTVVGRQLITAAGREFFSSVLGTITDGVVAGIEDLTHDGAGMANDVAVVGDGVGEAGASVVGRYENAEHQAEYGRHEITVSDSNIRDANSAGFRARSIYELSKNPVRVLSGASLKENFAYGINEMVPGDVWRLNVGELCELVQGAVRVHAISGSFGPEHDRVSLSFGPIGTTSVPGDVVEAVG